MSFDKGFDFRATSGFVVDPANCTFVIGDNYPTTRNGVTFGWTSPNSGQMADRNSGIDARLAGINYNGNANAPLSFRIDLPSPGAYTITLAIGDASAGQTDQHVVVKDNNTTLRTIDFPTGYPSDQFADAVGNLWTSDAAWVSSNVKDTQTFATTTFIISLGANNADATATTLAHIFLSQVQTTFGPIGRFVAPVLLW